MRNAPAHSVNVLLSRRGPSHTLEMNDGWPTVRKSQRRQLSPGTGVEMQRVLVLSVGAAIVLGAFAPLPAQQLGTVAGTVTDTSNAPIFSAELSVAGSDQRAFSDERGRFTIERLALGTHEITARRLGFTPVKVVVELSQPTGTSVSVRMKPVATALAPVVIHPDRLEYSGRLAGYYQRLEKRSSGYFITRDQIDRENPSNLGQLLQHVPGIRVGGGRGGITVMRMRGRNCWPLVWIDGVPMPAGDTDMDAFVPSSIQGIELYLGSTTAPMRYMGNRDVSSCGTVLIWSRGPDTDPVGSPQPTVDVEDLIDRAAVFNADSVDRPAAMDASRPVKPAFPPPLFAARVRGLTIAEFVVDTLGHVEDGTVAIVSSSDPLFSAAVRQALRGANYVPALKAGRPVRQLVHQPFRFDIGAQTTEISDPPRGDSSGTSKN